MDWCQNISLAR